MSKVDVSQSVSPRDHRLGDVKNTVIDMSDEPKVDDDEHADSDFQYADGHADHCQHASYADASGRCAMLTDWMTGDDQTPTRIDMAILMKYVHEANNTSNANDESELARGGNEYFSANTPQHLYSTGMTEVDADLMLYLNGPQLSLAHVTDFLMDRKFYRIAGLDGNRPANITVPLGITGLLDWSTAENVPEETRSALRDVAGRLQGCPLKNTACIVRLQLPPQHETNADLKDTTRCAINSDIVPEEAAPTQLWHRDKVDMGNGKGKPTVRVMSQPADALGHRWLGVRKMSEPNAQTGPS
jgi:hypothetical protein